MKGNVIQMNTLHLNSVRLNGIGKVQSVSLKGGSTEDPVFPPVEPPVEPTPTYTLSASVTNGKVTAKRNGSAVNLPFTANEGDTIVLEVTPNDGYTFEGWNDGNTDNPRTITMNADVALSAQCVEVVAPPVGKYIQFEDPAVEVICVANWSSDGIGLTEEDAAKVTMAQIGEKFRGNKEITSFNEFELFTGVTGMLGMYSFNECSALTSIKLPDGITNISGNSTLAKGAFYQCTSLNSIKLSASLKTIGANAFYGCPLTELTEIPSNVETIEFQAFAYAQFTSIKINEGCTKIGKAAFERCDKLIVAETPSTTTSILDKAFAYCSKLESVICRATTPPTLGLYVFTGTNSALAIYVPDASLEAYRTATNWNQFADRIHPLSEIEGDNAVIKYDGLVGAYTFKGRSNEDADYDLVQDRSGNGNVMSIDMVFGREDNVTGEVAGYCDYGIFMYRGFGKTTIPQLAESNTISIIAKRVLYAFEGVGEYSAFFGATENPNSNAVWFEYAEGGSFQSRNTKGEYMGRAETEIVWMTPTYMNGHRLTPTSERTMDGTCYLGRIRTTVNPTERTKVECLYIFNRELAPAEIESFIKAHIDADYVLPTIEQ